MRMRKGSRFDSRATMPTTGSSHCRISRFTIRSAAVIWSWRMDRGSYLKIWQKCDRPNGQALGRMLTLAYASTTTFDAAAVLLVA